MGIMKIRAACRSDFDAVLALNHESERFLSPLAMERLVQLDAQAELHQVLELQGKVVAFVLTLREGASYDSPNYRWFVARYPSFLYVDRVVVSASRHGEGMGRALYDVVFTHARATGVPWVTCEYDIEPPNPESERFHRQSGFKEVGRQFVAGGVKQVSLQAAGVAAHA
jgi:uncharacterized protein